MFNRSIGFWYLIDTDLLEVVMLVLVLVLVEGLQVEG